MKEYVCISEYIWSFWSIGYNFDSIGWFTNNFSIPGEVKVHAIWSCKHHGKFFSTSGPYIFPKF